MQNESAMPFSADISQNQQHSFDQINATENNYDNLQGGVAEYSSAFNSSAIDRSQI